MMMTCIELSVKRLRLSSNHETSRNKEVDTPTKEDVFFLISMHLTVITPKNALEEGLMLKGYEDSVRLK